MPDEQSQSMGHQYKPTQKSNKQIEGKSVLSKQMVFSDSVEAK